MNSKFYFFKINSTELRWGNRPSFGLAFAPYPFPCELFSAINDPNDPFEDDGAHCEDEHTD